MKGRAEVYLSMDEITVAVCEYLSGRLDNFPADDFGRVSVSVDNCTPPAIRLHWSLELSDED